MERCQLIYNYLECIFKPFFGHSGRLHNERLMIVAGMIVEALFTLGVLFAEELMELLPPKKCHDQPCNTQPTSLPLLLSPFLPDVL